MAYLAGPFVPDDVALWPAVDAADPTYQSDVQGTHADGSHAAHHTAQGGQ
jgi:hypothetical protein